MTHHSGKDIAGDSPLHKSQPCILVKIKHWLNCKPQWFYDLKCESTHQLLKHMARRTKQFADRHRGETPQYNPGDQVWLTTKDLRNTGCKKLNAKYIGPYKVLQHITEVTYKLNLLHHCRITSSLQYMYPILSYLKPIMSETLPSDMSSTTPPKPFNIDGQPAFI